MLQQLRPKPARGSMAENFRLIDLELTFCLSKTNQIGTDGQSNFSG